MYKLLIAIAATALLAACSGAVDGGSSGDVAAKVDVLSEVEREYINLTITDDVSTYYDGGESILGTLIARVQSPTVVKDFTDNEVAALQKYKDRLTGISGTITGIQAGINDAPFVTLSGGSKYSLNQPILKFFEGDVPKIAELKKGSKITVICQFENEIAGTAVFKECMMSETGQAAFAGGAIESINKGDIKKASDDMTIHDTLGAYTYVVAKSLSDVCTGNQNAECFDKGDNLTKNKLKAKAAELNIDLKLE